MSDSQLLWTLLLLLLALVILVGPKASASEVALKPDSRYNHPMLAFELEAAQAPNLFIDWNEQTKSRLRVAIYWDFLFLLIYPAAIAVACYLAGQFLEAKGIIPFRITLIVICLQLLAAVCDATENWLLLRVLSTNQAVLLSSSIKAIATTKFLLLILGSAYSVLLGGGAWLIHQVKNQ